jgi:hypothetical protein
MWGSRRLEHKVFDDLVGGLEITMARRDVSSESDCFEISCKSRVQYLVAEFVGGARRLEGSDKRSSMLEKH